MTPSLGGHHFIRANARRSIPLASGSVHCVVTSPPYWAQRNYGVDGQLGIEKTPEEFVANQVSVFREVRRALRDDGSLFLNIGDSYFGGKGMAGGAEKYARGEHAVDARNPARRFGVRPTDVKIDGLKKKDLVGIPWLLAFALRADGWYLRCDNIWNGINKMPESVLDRSSRSHEYVFHLTKKPKYYYDKVAERKPQATLGRRHEGKSGYREGHPSKGGVSSRSLNPLGGAVRSVWSISSQPFKGAHFATMPIALARRCISLGSSSKGCCPNCGTPWHQVIERNRVATRPGRDTKTLGHSGEEMGNRDPQRHVTDVCVVGWESGCSCREPHPIPCTIFDPFGGAGTTAKAAQELGRSSISTELSAEYIAIAQERLALPVLAARAKRTTGARSPSLGGRTVQPSLFGDLS